MNESKRNFYVGIFVIIGMLCCGYLIIVMGDLSGFFKDRYTVYGYFTSASGLKKKAVVELAGVKIGHVSAISIDRQYLVARVTLDIDRKMAISEDSIASIKTAGIIGEKYIEILPGGSDTMLVHGDEIENTESSLDIESLIRKFIFNENTL